MHLYENPAATYAEVKAALRLSAEDMKQASKDLFLAIFQTIDNRKAQMKISINNLYPGNGIETFKYLYKKFGIKETISALDGVYGDPSAFLKTS